MALTAEQQAEIQLEVDKLKFRLEAEIEAGIFEKEARRDLEREISRRKHEIVLEQQKNRMELIRLAKEVLIEKNRSKPVESRDISADDVTTFAKLLISYVEGE